MSITEKEGVELLKFTLGFTLVFFLKVFLEFTLEFSLEFSLRVYPKVFPRIYPRAAQDYTFYSVTRCCVPLTVQSSEERS